MSVVLPPFYSKHLFSSPTEWRGKLEDGFISWRPKGNGRWISFPLDAQSRVVPSNLRKPSLSPAHFDIILNKRRFTFFAKTERERDLWIHDFNLYIETTFGEGHVRGSILKKGKSAPHPSRRLSSGSSLLEDALSPMHMQRQPSEGGTPILSMRFPYIGSACFGDSVYEGGFTDFDFQSMYTRSASGLTPIRVGKMDRLGLSRTEWKKKVRGMEWQGMLEIPLSDEIGNVSFPIPKQSEENEKVRQSSSPPPISMKADPSPSPLQVPPPPAAAAAASSTATASKPAATNAQTLDENKDPKESNSSPSPCLEARETVEETACAAPSSSSPSRSSPFSLEKEKDAEKETETEPTKVSVLCVRDQDTEKEEDEEKRTRETRGSGGSSTVGKQAEERKEENGEQEQEEIVEKGKGDQGFWLLLDFANGQSWADRRKRRADVLLQLHKRESEKEEEMKESIYRGHLSAWEKALELMG